MQACLNELPNHCYKHGWTAKRCYNFPRPITADCVKSFDTVDKDPYFVFDSSVGNAWLKGSYLLVFWLPSIHTDLLIEFQPDQDIHAGESVGFGQYLPGNRQYNEEMSLWLSLTSISYVWVNYCYILEFLWDSLLPSHAVTTLQVCLSLVELLLYRSL